MDDRLARERDFHDARFADEDDGRRANRFYAINEASNRFFEQAIEAVPPGANMLDYGCGAGAYAALHGARHGHRVTAIDLSPVAIEQAGKEAERRGLADRIEFRVANAEDLPFAADEFDLVCGLGVLHHLELADALPQIARVMRPSATAAFVEPLGHNPVINLYRRRTPDQRTADEHPLVMEDFELLRERFGSVDVDYFHLLDLLALPFVGRRSFGRLLRRLDAADRVLLRTPARRWACMVGVRLAAPRAV